MFDLFELVVIRNMFGASCVSQRCFELESLSATLAEGAIRNFHIHRWKKLRIVAVEQVHLDHFYAAAPENPANYAVKLS